MKITNLLLVILIGINFIIAFRLFTLNTPQPQKKEAVEKKTKIEEPQLTFYLNNDELKRINSLKLKDNYSEQDVRAYLDRIYEISYNKRGWSDDIPEIAKLSMINADYIPILLDYLNKNNVHNRFSYALIKAMCKTIREDQLPLIISNLSKNHDLIEILFCKNRNWIKNAKDILFSSIKERNEFYLTKWITAVSIVADSTIYPDLKYYFIHGANQHYTFECLKDLPGFDLANAVDSVWKLKKDFRDKYDETGTAKMAAQFGHRDALDLLIRSMLSPKEGWCNESDIRDIVEIPWDETNIPKWYKINRDRLRFDKTEKKWKLSKEINRGN